MTQMTMIEAIRSALSEEMERDERVLVMGEDIGTLGGVFRATDGLLAKFGPERVIDTPMAELSIAGIAVGMAMKGLRPVAEIQFADFIHAATDHIIGEAAKVRYRSAGDWACPLVIRTAYGGGLRGGPYHSQSVEGFYTHVPGLKVLAPSTPADARGLLIAAIRDPDPVLFLEHKRTYRLIKGDVPESDGFVSIGRASIARHGTDVTAVSYGMMLHETLAAAELLNAEGISVEVIDLRSLIPLDRATILASLQHTGRLCIVHEDTRTMGFGAELAALAAEEALDVLKAPVCRVTAPDVGGIPVSPPMEEFVLPNRDKIAAAIRNLMTKQRRVWSGAEQAPATAPSLDPWTRSALEIPQAASMVEIDLSRLLASDDMQREIDISDSADTPLTLFVLEAVASQLSAYPDINSVFEGDHIRRYSNVDILLGIAQDDDIKYGIIEQADTRNLFGLDLFVDAIRDKGQTTTTPKGGTFSFTDLGKDAALFAVPPVLPGHAAALRMGAVKQRLVPHNGGIALVPYIILTLSVDHRVVDGAMASEFLGQIKFFLEEYGRGA